MSVEKKSLPEEQLAARLREIEDAKAKPKARAGRKGALIGLAAGVSVIVLSSVYLATRKSDDSTLEAGASDGFQTQEGGAFGEMPPPQKQVIVEDNSETEKLIAELRKQLEDMRRQIANTPDAPPIDDSRLTALADEIDRMKKAEAERLTKQEKLLREKDLEMQRLLAELEMARLREQEPAEEMRNQIHESRISSGMLAYGGTGDEQGSEPNSELEKRKLSQNEAFVRDVAEPAPIERSKVIVNPGNTVVQGTMIQASLETAIDSTLPGDIRAVVASDVHAFDGSRILIPRGSRVVGKYSEEIRLGQKRVLVAWNRLIMPDSQSVTISAYGGSELGVSGVTGNVDSHFKERFGSAALISLISAGPALLATQFDNGNGNSAASNLGTSAGQTLQQSTQNVVGEYLRIKPTITVAQGARVTIMVDRDLEIF